MSTVFQQPFGAEARWLDMPADPAHSDDLWCRWAGRVAGSPAVWGPDGVQITRKTPLRVGAQVAAAHGRVDHVVRAGRWLAHTLPAVVSHHVSSPVRVADLRPVLEEAAGGLSDVEFTAAMLFSGHNLGSMDLSRNPMTTVSKIGLDWYLHQRSRTAFAAGRRACHWLEPVTVSVGSILEASARIPVNTLRVCSPDQRLDRAAAAQVLPEIQSLADQLVDSYPASPLTSDTDRSAYSCSLTHALEAERSRAACNGNTIIAAAVAGYDVAAVGSGSPNAYLGIDENIAQMLRARSRRLARQLETAA